MSDDQARPAPAAPAWTVSPDGSAVVPPQMPPGEELPPVPVAAAVGLTQPDAKGRRWAVLELRDGTVSMTVRIPWQAAEQFGMGIAQGLAAMQAKAASEQHQGLIVPNGAGGRPGQLLIPNVIPGARRG